MFLDFDIASKMIRFLLIKQTLRRRRETVKKAGKEGQNQNLIIKFRHLG